MGILRAIGTLLSPRKTDFIKRLVAWRLDNARDHFGSLKLPEGSAEHRIRQLSLGTTDFLVSPEATIANVLENYWKPNVQWIVSFRQDHLRIRTAEEQANERRRQMESAIAHIEYLLSGNPQAANTIPPGLDLVDYIKHRVRLEHPGYRDLEAYGITDDLVNYAIGESKYVFHR